METVYKFEDWTSASRMRNSRHDNCDYKIRVKVITKNTDDGKEIEGYQIIVYHEMTQVDIYRFYVDYGEEGVWSLNTEEAIEILNKIGFRCTYERDHYNLTDKMKNTLRSLIQLGYTHIWRNADQEVLVSGNNPYKPHLFKSICDQIGYDYNYYNFIFLPYTPTSILGILEGAE